MPHTIVVVCVALLVSCTVAPHSPASRYERWLGAGYQTKVQGYHVFLKRDKVSDVVPMNALLRTSRRWQLCRHDEFSIPPPALWRNMTATLHVVRELRDAGILDPALARSVYRDTAVNRCAGGSAGSKHRDNRAIDFDLPANPENVARFCASSATARAEVDMGIWRSSMR